MPDTVIISNLPSHSPSGSDYLAVEDSSLTGKATVNDVVGASSSVATINTKIGSTALPTTAQTLTGAIAEHESDISTLNSNLSGVLTGLSQTDNFQSATTLTYTGSSITIPKNRGFIIKCTAVYVNAKPEVVVIASSGSSSSELASGTVGNNFAHAMHIGRDATSANTFYAWAKYSIANTQNRIQWTVLYVPA